MKVNNKLFELALELVNCNYGLNQARLLEKKQTNNNKEFNDLLIKFKREISVKLRRPINQAEAYKIARNLVMENIKKGLKKTTLD